MSLTLRMMARRSASKSPSSLARPTTSALDGSRRMPSSRRSLMGARGWSTAPPREPDSPAYAAAAALRVRCRLGREGTPCAAACFPQKILGFRRREREARGREKKEKRKILTRYVLKPSPSVTSKPNLIKIYSRIICYIQY